MRSDDSGRRAPCFAAWLFMLALGAFSPWTTAAQETEPSLTPVREAVSNGDAGRLVAMTSGRLELALIGPSRQYSRSQAKLVLGRFFEEHPPRSFEIVDSTRSTTGLFVEGRIRIRESDRVLRVYLRMNRSGKDWLLREMLIENADR